MRRLALLLLLGPAAAAAQTISVGQLQMTLKNRIDNGGGNIVYQNFNGTEQLEFFSLASCCDDKKFGVEMTLTGAPVGDLGNFKVELWLGTNCSDTSANNPNRLLNCVKVDTRSLEDFHNHVVDVDFSARLLMNPQGGCPAKMGTSTVWGLIDSNADGIYDTGGIFQLTPAVSYDTQPPPAVDNPSVVGVEDGISVSWSVPSSIADVARYQILCADTDGRPLYGVARGDAGVVGSPPDPEYRLPAMMCAATPTADAGPAGADAGPVPDAGSQDPNMAMFDALDPRYTCSGSIGYTSGSARIDLTNVGLDPDQEVIVKVISIDPSRNYTAVDVPGMARPQPVKNAWTVYQDAGGRADGGFCFVATAVYGDYDHPYVRVLRTFRDETLATFGLGRAFIGWYYAHSPPWAEWLRAHAGARVVAQVLLFPVVVLAWLWNHLGLALLAVPALAWFLLRRRRRRRMAAVAAAALLLCLVAGPASAQVILDEEARPAVPRSEFAFEIKLGPYHPDVDSEPGLAFRPYDTTFGTGKIILPQIELDWFPFHYWGELGLAFSLGYTQQTAHSFIFDPGNPTDLNNRSADTTGFHLLPFSVSVVYRFTELADRTYVPIVPYVKLGLSYYTWWVTRGTGALATTKTGKDALGATPGWQTSVGLTFRVDAIDPDASKNLSVELGIEHVGLFFELTYANVSGLWMSDKLYVGDLYWSGGVNFEF